jgi:hypothetical protein
MRTYLGTSPNGIVYALDTTWEGVGKVMVERGDDSAVVLDDPLPWTFVQTLVEMSYLCGRKAVVDNMDETRIYVDPDFTRIAHRILDVLDNLSKPPMIVHEGGS